MNSLTNYQVLYADDDQDARLMVTVMLGFADIKVVTAGTVAETCWLAETKGFDLFLLDTRFPDGSGFDLCRCLRELAPRKPILFYSGDAFETDKQKGLGAGADAYLTKPYLEDLAATVRQTIENIREPEEKSNLNMIESSVRIYESFLQQKQQKT